MDFSVNLHLSNGAVLQGGTSTGRVIHGHCFVVDSPAAVAQLQSHLPFLTQVKVLGVYPWPWWGLQTSAASEPFPGPRSAPPGHTAALK